MMEGLLTSRLSTHMYTYTYSALEEKLESLSDAVSSSPPQLNTNQSKSMQRKRRR